MRLRGERRAVVVERRKHGIIGRRIDIAVADERDRDSAVGGKTKGRAEIGDDQVGPDKRQERIPRIDHRREIAGIGKADDREQVGIVRDAEGTAVDHGRLGPDRRLQERAIICGEDRARADHVLQGKDGVAALAPERARKLRQRADMAQIRAELARQQHRPHPTPLVDAAGQTALRR